MTHKLAPLATLPISPGKMALPEDQPMNVTADLFGLTHIGKVRETNEDQFLVAELSKSLLIAQTSLPPEDHTRLFGGPPGKLLVVADGIGGARGGRRASRLVVETGTRYVLDTMHWFFTLKDGEEADLVEELRRYPESRERARWGALRATTAFRRVCASRELRLLAESGSISPR